MACSVRTNAESGMSLNRNSYEGASLHALVDLVQQCEKDRCSFSDMRPYTQALDLIRARVAPGGESLDATGETDAK